MVNGLFAHVKNSVLFLYFEISGLNPYFFKLQNETNLYVRSSYRLFSKKTFPKKK